MLMTDAYDGRVPDVCQTYEADMAGLWRSPGRTMAKPWHGHYPVMAQARYGRGTPMAREGSLQVGFIVFPAVSGWLVRCSIYETTGIVD
jgi:hypothetical protein